MGKPRDEKSEATNTHISSSTIGNSKQRNQMNILNGYLVAGMCGLQKTRKSGANMGHGQSKGTLAKCSMLGLFMAGTSQDHPQILLHCSKWTQILLQTRGVTISRDCKQLQSHFQEGKDMQKQFEDSVDNGHARISETDISPKNKLAENVTGISNDKNSRVNSKKSKNKKELTMPRRLSQRLAGHEPEVLLTEKAIKYATRKFCNDKPATTEILTNGVSGHLHIREESKLVLQASDRLKTLYGESSSKSGKSYDPQTVPNEQLQRLEAENVADDRSDPLFPTPFGNWSHPCLEFEIETLSGALLVDAPTATAAAGILPVMTPDVNAPANKELLDNPNQSQTKKEFSTVCKPSNKFWTSSS
ncbi:hypothetical protein glysoja_018293 [Glycine soja]|nr:hypothetical protein glysoja_018293 [Glycine soja]